MKTLSQSLLFAATQRRFSLVTLPQAINRLLQSSAVVSVASANTIKTATTNDHLLFKYGTNAGRRKKLNKKNLPCLKK